MLGNSNPLSNCPPVDSILMSGIQGESNEEGWIDVTDPSLEADILGLVERFEFNNSFQLEDSIMGAMGGLELTVLEEVGRWSNCGGN